MLQVTEDTRRSLEVDGLIERWQQHRDERAFERLLKLHRYIIVEEARRYRWSGSEYADRVAAGHEGFLVAVGNAKAGSSAARFVTYCRRIIRQRMIDDRRLSDVGDPSSPRWDGNSTGEDGAECVPLESVADVLVDPAPSPERAAIARHEAGALLNAMNTLSDKQRRVIEALHLEGLTQAETAERLGIDERHVRRLAQQACDILHHHMT